jgi:CubicO group peptidase (beta-lactamase class C family)
MVPISRTFVYSTVVSKEKMKKGIIISVLLFALLQGYSQNIDLERSKAIDSIVNQYVKEYSIVGLSIGIVHNDMNFTKHYGFTDQRNGYQITDSTLFLTSSISKLFTAFDYGFGD